MTSEVVHHVAFSAEALAAVLGAVEGPVVVVYPHVDGQIMPIVEGLLAGGHSAYKICSRLMVCKVSLEILTGPKFLRAGAESAAENFGDFHS